MKPSELKQLQHLRNKVIEGEIKYGDYKKKLAENCTHPESERDEWSHSTSNGFGRWSTEIMPYCKICGKVQYNSAYNHRWGPVPVNNYAD